MKLVVSSPTRNATHSVAGGQLSVDRKNSVNREPITVNRKAKGFTLIEFLITIGIIALLVAAGTYSWTNAQAKSRDNRRKQDLIETQKALEFYFQTNGKYPVGHSVTEYKIACISPYNDTILNWGDSFACTNATTGQVDAFMQKLPKDPLYQTKTQGYRYQSGGSPPYSTYTLSAVLENTNDPEVDANCDGADRNFCVISPK